MKITIMVSAAAVSYTHLDVYKRQVRISIYEGMFHIFQMAAKMLPESKRAWVEIGKFIDVLLND